MPAVICGKSAEILLAMFAAPVGIVLFDAAKRGDAPVPSQQPTRM